MGGWGQIGKVGLLGGLGAPVNNCQQCRKQPSWGACSIQLLHPFAHLSGGRMGWIVSGGFG